MSIILYCIVHFDVVFTEYNLLSCSHLIGFFYRTIRMLDNGIKPV